MQHRRGGGDRRDRRPYGDRPDRPPRDARDERGGFRGPREDRGGFGGPREDRGGFGGPRDFREERGRFGAPPRSGPRPDRFAPRGADEGGMSLRLDPRRLGLLKQLAAEQGLRPGELVTRWVEERVDAERAGGPAGGPSATLGGIAELSARVDDLARRIDAMSGPPAAIAAGQEAAAEAAAASDAGAPAEPAAPAEKGGGRSGRAAAARASRDGSGPRVALHDEIIAVIGERGPMTAAELASAIAERGRYSAPRSGKPLDAATVSARVSNPVYRSRFRRVDGRIALAEE